MKKALTIPALSYLTLGLGGTGIALQLWLLQTGVDEKGLLTAAHPAGLLIWILVACTMVLLFLATRKTGSGGRYGDNFPASIQGCVGYCLAAAGIFYTSLTDLLHHAPFLDLVAGVLGILCCPALLAAGYFRLKGRRPSFLLHVPVCLYFTLHVLCQYRHWSSEPQLLAYCFQLLSCVGLMLTAYHRTTFDLNMGSRRAYTFFNLATVFFCCLALPSSANRFFYLSTGAWLFTNLCAPAPVRNPEERAS